MIYTCTTNPSLDYYVSISDVKTGEKNYSEYEMFEAGGKGVNVSIILNNMHIKTVCLGFLGGFTKDFYLSFLNNFPNIQPLFTTIKGNTRINVKIMDCKDETSLNAVGPIITDEEFNKFKNRLGSIYDNDIFVLSGLIQEGIVDKMVEVIHNLTNDGVKVALDTDKAFIDRCLDAKPFLVKVNDKYLKDAGLNEIDACKDLISKGAQNVLYSGIRKSSLYFNNEIGLKCDNLADNVPDITGVGDSMVGGLLYGIIRGADAVESFKYANAAAIATSLSNDLGSKNKVEEVLQRIEVTSL